MNELSRATIDRGLRAPSSVTIVGDSPGDGPGGLIHQRLLDVGYPGRTLPVNPKYVEVRGARAYPSMQDIEGPPGFVAIAVGAQRAVESARSALELGATGLAVIGGGFAEAGESGRALQLELRKMALEHQIPLIGPNCYGMVDVRGRFAPYFGALAMPLEPGPVSLIFQSGALTHAAMDPFIDRAPGYAYIFTAGNEAVLTVADYLEYVLADSSSRVVGCYLESVRDPARFVRGARRAAEIGVRLVVLKAGRSDLGRRAALAHTGAVAGEDRVWDAALRDLGVMRVHDIDELRETIAAAAGLPELPPGDLAVLSISGGGSAVVADVAADVGTGLAKLGEATARDLGEILPALATVSNPLDLTGAVVADPGLVTRAVETVSRDPAVGQVAFALNSPMAVDSTERALYRLLARAALEAPRAKPLVLFSLVAGNQDPEILRMGREAGVPILQGSRPTLKALAVLQASGRASTSAAGPASALISSATRSLVVEEAPGALPGTVVRALLEEIGIAVPRAILAADAAAAERAADELGYPVVLKVASPDVLHRTDIGGVAVGLADGPEVRRAFVAIEAAVGERAPGALIEGVEVHEQVPGGVEVLLGMTVEPGLPPVVVVGPGGTLVELHGGVTMAIAPVSHERAREMLTHDPLARLLGGYRGAAPADTEALADAIVRLGRLADELADVLSAFEINPVTVLPVGGGVRALDILGVRA